MGQYDSHKMGPNARTVYRDEREHYFFLNSAYKWSVSSNTNKYILIHTTYFYKLSLKGLTPYIICVQKGWS